MPHAMDRSVDNPLYEEAAADTKGYIEVGQNPEGSAPSKVVPVVSPQMDTIQRRQVVCRQ